jgi:predicted TIM-barrel fold metal-dependent hydrolase
MGTLAESITLCARVAKYMSQKLSVLGVEHTALEYAMPNGACDCHTHIFGPHEEFALSKSRQYTPPEALLSDLVKLHDGLGLARVVLVHPSPYGSDNSCTLRALNALKGRGRGVVVIDKTLSKAELQRMHALGVRGVRINLQTQGIHDLSMAQEQIDWTARMIQHLGWHIQLVTQLGVIARLESVINQYDTGFVVDHFGLINPDLGLDQAGLHVLLGMIRNGKVWMKLSAPQRISKAPDSLSVTQLARALIACNPQRMLWGSDWPHTGGAVSGRRSIEQPEPFSPVDDGAALNRLQRWAPTPEMLQRILVSNPAVLYDF